MYFVLALMLQTQTPPVQPTPELPVSLERIRRGLDQQPTITVTYGVSNLLPFFQVKVEEQWLDIDGQWRETLPVPTFVRPSRGLTHHEFVGMVTPDLFRGTVQHPCCDVLPAIEALGSAIARGRRKRAESRARREVQKALEEFKKSTERR
jgi:hypothetical protein